MIEVQHLTKRYGNLLAVDDLTFTIDDGHVYGFLGPNGAGKSTTMNIMTGCLSATSGTVEIDGYNIFDEPAKAKRLMGYLPEQPPLYMSETPLEYLRFVGEAKGLRGAELARQIADVTEKTGLGPVRGRRISTLSKGYRQRVGIAQALMGEPRVVILDEPTVGLHPIQKLEIRDLIRELGRERTVIFSSHILSEVQAICDRILIIHRGRLVAFDEPAALERQMASGSRIQLLTDASPEEAEELLSGVPGALETQADEREGLTSVTVCVDAEDIRQVSRDIFFRFAGASRALLEMTVKRASLEDVFLELTESPAAGDEPEDGEPEDGEPENPELPGDENGEEEGEENK